MEVEADLLRRQVGYSLLLMRVWVLRACSHVLFTTAAGLLGGRPCCVLLLCPGRIMMPGRSEAHSLPTSCRCSCWPRSCLGLSILHFFTH